MTILKQVFKVTDSLGQKIVLPGITPETDLEEKVEEISDQLDGGLDSSNMSEYRNTMVFNDWGNCDPTYPFIMDFELIEEMTKLVECKVTFKQRNYQSSTTGAASDGGETINLNRLLIEKQLTTTDFDKAKVQIQISGDKIYYVWQETDGSNTQIWTAVSDLDGENFTATKQTTDANNRVNPRLQVFEGKVYYVYQEIVSSHYALIHTVADLDGTNWSATQLYWLSGHGIYDPQLHIVGTKIYYVFCRLESLGAGALWTGYSDLDGSNFSMTQQDTDSTHIIYPPQLQVVGIKIYYVYTIYIAGTDPYHQIMVATSDLDGENFSTTKKTTTAYNKKYPQFQVVGTKIYYTWEESDGTNAQVWTAIMNTDGSGWSATERTIDSLAYIHPQLHVMGNYIYYTFDNSNQLASAIIKIDQTGWTYKNETTRVSTKNTPQIQVYFGDVTYCWIETVGGYDQIFLGSGYFDSVTTNDHTHNQTYGIYEEDNTATICFYVRKVGGKWSIKHGPYTTDQADIEITKILVEGKGKYQIKFESDVLTGISAGVMCKVDIKARS